MGVLVAYINFVYAELFYSKWMERCALIETPARVIELESLLIEREGAFNEVRSRLIESESKIIENESELKELRLIRKQIDADRTCPHCQQLQANANTLRAHKGHCPKNPINKINSTN